MQSSHTLRDGTAIAYTVYAPLANAARHGIALLAHPYGPLGGSQRDHVVVAVARALSSAGYRVFTYDARGAGSSQGKTSWT